MMRLMRIFTKKPGQRLMNYQKYMRLFGRITGVFGIITRVFIRLRSYLDELRVYLGKLWEYMSGIRVYPGDLHQYFRRSLCAFCQDVYLHRKLYCGLIDDTGFSYIGLRLQ
jgi:hypothetical protein